MNRLFGLERHGVYVDRHFQLATPVIRLTTVIDGREVVIPSFDAEGHPEVRGRYWVTWTFPLRTNLNGFYKHSERFVRAYFKDRGLTPRDVRVEMRPAWVPLRWDFETVERLKAETWMDGGRMRFDGERYIHELTPALETEMGRGIVRSRM